MAHQHYYSNIFDDNVKDDGANNLPRFDMKFSQPIHRTDEKIKQLNGSEQCILSAINNVIRNWYEPWKTAYLANGREFKVVYDLMEDLLHYESQVTSLPEERTRAIAQAVARLIDYGNAILGIDITLRIDDEPLREFDPDSSTTIQLYHAHVKAHNLREKLLYDYFKSRLDDDEFPSNSSSTLQVPSSLTSTLERGHKSLGGSNTSINTMPDVRKQQVLIKQSSVASTLLLLKSSAFRAPNGSNHRAITLPTILTEIESLLSVPTNVEKTTSCFELLDSLLDTIEQIPADSRIQEVLMISNSLFKPLVKKVYIDDNTHWTVCLISIIRLMNASGFDNYLQHFTTTADLAAFLKDYLFLVKRLVSQSNHPACWIEMTLLVSSTFFTSLTYLCQVLVQRFATNLSLWNSFIDCLIHFILQETLKPDRTMLKERQRLMADHLRQGSAEYVWISWDFLNIDQKQHLLEDLIEPLLRASIVLSSRQRSILLPIFYDMMRCDYTSQYITPRVSMCASTSTSLQDDLESLPPLGGQQDYISHSKLGQALPYLSYRDMSIDGTVLTRFTHLVIGKLNILMNEQDRGDELFKDELCAAMSGQLNPKYHDYNSQPNPALGDTTRFKSKARQTADLVGEFMQISLDARQANKLSYKHLYMLCLFKLVLFFKDKVDNPELYLNNLYKLWRLNHSAGRYAEAGYTLLEHAKTLPWSDTPLENHFLRLITRFFQVPQSLPDYNSLKIFLYDTIINYFDEAQLWEQAVPLCRELIDFYEFKAYDYIKVADVLQRMSTCFNNMVQPGKRNNPEYFRVSFYGAGFPGFLRNVTTVYRGKPYEKLGDFQKTLLSKYPDAQLLNSLAKPDDSILDSPESRYLQINACSPIVDLRSKFGSDLSKINERVLDYYRHNECDKFQFTRRIANPNNGQISDDNFANMWRERTTLTTNSLPGILPFFPAYLVEPSNVSPIENAIEDLERTNDRLSCMVNRFKADKRQEEDVRLLGQLLLGVVDAAVNGGITKYEEAFFNDISTLPPTSSSSSSTLTTGPSGLHVRSSEEMPKQTGGNYIWQSRGAADDERPSADQVDKLKRLIAQQVPLLDEAIRFHRDRVAEVMRPQHEHLEASYKKLKHNVMTKYAKHLPPEYSRSTMRSYRSLARSPNRSIRSESRLPLMSSNTATSGASMTKRNPDTSSAKPISLPQDSSPSPTAAALSNIPYRQLDNERRSLPSLASERITTPSDSRLSKEEDSKLVSFL